MMTFFKKIVLVGLNSHAVTAVSISACFRKKAKDEKPKPAFKKGALVHYGDEVAQISEIVDAESLNGECITYNLDIPRPNNEWIKHPEPVEQKELRSYEEFKGGDVVKLVLPIYRVEKDENGKKKYEMARLPINCSSNDYVTVAVNTEGVVAEIQDKHYVVKIDEKLVYDDVTKECLVKKGDYEVKVPKGQVVKIQYQNQVGRVAYPHIRDHASFHLIKKQTQAEVDKNVHYQIQGIFTIILTVLIAFRFPIHFFWLHIAKNFYYYYHRIKYFFTKHEELFMFEWCYLIGAAITLWCICQSFRSLVFGADSYSANNHEAIQAGFAIGNGALAFSVIQAKNSLVLHDVNQLSMAFLHTSPAIVAWCIRWWSIIMPAESSQDTYPYMFDPCDGIDMYEVRECSWWWCDSVCTPGENFLMVPVLACFTWCVLHFLVFDVYLKEWRTKNGKTHLLDDMIMSPPKKDWCCLGEVRDTPTFAGLYYTNHFIFNVVTMCLSYVFWQSFWLHTAWLGLLIFLLAHNGAVKTFTAVVPRHENLQLAKIGYEKSHFAPSKKKYIEEGKRRTSEVFQQHEIYDSKGRRSSQTSNNPMVTVDFEEGLDTDSAGSVSSSNFDFEHGDVAIEMTTRNNTKQHEDFHLQGSNPMIFSDNASASQNTVASLRNSVKIEEPKGFWSSLFSSDEKEKQGKTENTSFWSNLFSSDEKPSQTISRKSSTTMSQSPKNFQHEFARGSSLFMSDGETKQIKKTTRRKSGTHVAFNNMERELQDLEAGAYENGSASSSEENQTTTSSSSNVDNTEKTFQNYVDDFYENGTIPSC